MSGRKRNAQGASGKQRPNKRPRRDNDDPCEKAIVQAERMLERYPSKETLTTAEIVAEFLVTDNPSDWTMSDEEAVTERWNRCEVSKSLNAISRSTHSELLRLWKLSLRLLGIPPLYFTCPRAMMQYQPVSKNGKMDLGLYSKNFCNALAALMAHPCWGAEYIKIIRALQYAITCRIDDRRTMTELSTDPDGHGCPVLQLVDKQIEASRETGAPRSIHKMHASARRRADGEPSEWSNLLFHIGETVKEQSSKPPPVVDAFLSDGGRPTLPLTLWDLEVVTKAVNTMEHSQEEFRYSVADALKAWNNLKSGRDSPSMEQLSDLYVILTKDNIKRALIDEKRNAPERDSEVEASPNPGEEQDEEQRESDAPESAPESARESSILEGEDKQGEEEEEEGEEEDHDEPELSVPGAILSPVLEEEIPDEEADALNAEADPVSSGENEVIDDGLAESNHISSNENEMIDDGLGYMPEVPEYGSRQDTPVAKGFNPRQTTLGNLLGLFSTRDQIPSSRDRANVERLERENRELREVFGNVQQVVEELLEKQKEFREEIKSLREDNKRVHEEYKSFREENKRIHNENKLIHEENKKIKEDQRRIQEVNENLLDDLQESTSNLNGNFQLIEETDKATQSCIDDLEKAVQRRRKEYNKLVDKQKSFASELAEVKARVEASTKESLSGGTIQPKETDSGQQRSPVKHTIETEAEQTSVQEALTKSTSPQVEGPPVEQTKEAETQETSGQEASVKSTSAQSPPVVQGETQKTRSTEQNTMFVQTSEADIQEKQASAEEDATHSTSTQAKVSLVSQDLDREARSTPVNESELVDQTREAESEGSKAVSATDASQDGIRADLPKDLSSWPAEPLTWELQSSGYMGSYNTMNHPRSKPLKHTPTPTQEWATSQQNQG